MTSTPEFIAANAVEHREQLVELNMEYMSWVFDGVSKAFQIPVESIAGMPVADYVPSVIDKVCGDAPPRGIFYLVRIDGALAGMGGLRFVRKGVAEVKRIYVRPGFRGRQMGVCILDRLLDDARTFGYEQVCLDSGPFMKSAHRLYESKGFRYCAAYDGAEVPEAFHDRWCFMERVL